VRFIKSETTRDSIHERVKSDIKVYGLWIKSRRKDFNRLILIETLNQIPLARIFMIDFYVFEMVLALGHLKLIRPHEMKLIYDPWVRKSLSNRIRVGLQSIFKRNQIRFGCFITGKEINFHPGWFQRTLFLIGTAIKQIGANGYCQQTEISPTKRTRKPSKSINKCKDI